MVRSHRRAIEKLIFSQTFRCKDCNWRKRDSYLRTGLLEEYASCPRCGNLAPDRRSKPDKVDSMLHTPLRFLYKIVGGKLYHCVFCRLQFYDTRPLKPMPKKEVATPANRARLAS